MSTEPSNSSRSLPEKPDLRLLEDQASDLARAGNSLSLDKAQLQLAREYGFANWAEIKTRVEFLAEIGELKAGIDSNDIGRVQELMTRNPALHRAPLGYGKNGPLTWVAECRVPRVPPSAVRLEMARWMIENGSDVYQGGDGPLMRAAFRKQLVDMGDSAKEQMREYHDVTAIGYARQFPEPNWVNDAAIEAVLEYGGQ